MSKDDEKEESGSDAFVFAEDVLAELDAAYGSTRRPEETVEHAPALPPSSGPPPRSSGTSLRIPRPDQTSTPPTVNPSGPPREEPFPLSDTPPGPATRDNQRAQVPTRPSVTVAAPKRDRSGPSQAAPDVSRLPSTTPTTPSTASHPPTLIEDAEAALTDEEIDSIIPAPSPSRLPDASSRPGEALEIETGGEVLLTAEEQRAVSEQPDRISDGGADTQGAEGAGSEWLSAEVATRWIERARLLEREAELRPDKTSRAQTLLAASELLALAGDGDRSRRLADRARELAPSLHVAVQQSRALAARDGDFSGVVELLQHEYRAANTREAKAHAAYLSAEIQRVVLADSTASQAKMEQVVRSVPSDVRAALLKLTSQLASSKGAVNLRWPDTIDSEELKQAVQQLRQLRSERLGQTPGAGGSLTAFEHARRALAVNDAALAGEAVLALAEVPGLERPARWLAASLLAPQSSSRANALRILLELVDAGEGRPARRAATSRMLELLSTAEAQPELQETVQQARARTLTSADPGSETDAFSPEDRVALALLLGSARKHDGTGEPSSPAPTADPTLDRALDTLARDSVRAPLAAAAATTLELSLAQPSDPDILAQIQLGRSLAAVDSREALSALSQQLPDELEQHPLGQQLALEEARPHPDFSRLSKALASVSSADDMAQAQSHVARALLLDLAGADDAAIEQYRAVLNAAPASEFAVRAIAAKSASLPAELLTDLADALDQPERQALLLLEAAAALGLERSAELEQLLERAINLDPTLPFSYRLAEQLGRSRGNVAQLLGVIRRHHEACATPQETAHDLTRQALLVADEDQAGAAEALEQASALQPNDFGLRELYERVRSSPAEDVGAWRAARAETANDPRQAAALLLEASLAYEQSGQYAEAAEAAHRAASLGMDLPPNAGISGLARVQAQRLLTRTGAVDELAAELLAEAERERDVERQQQLYLRLIALEERRGDRDAMLARHRAILQATPDYLPSLRYLEHTFLEQNSEGELAQVSTHLAQNLSAKDAVASAALAIRLTIKHGEWQRAHEPANVLAASDTVASSQRLKNAFARQLGDDPALLDSTLELARSAETALDRSVLWLRAAEVAIRMGRPTDAEQYLKESLEAFPQNLITLEALAELQQSQGDPETAAAAHEAMGKTSGVAEHRAAALRDAALIWLDKGRDPARGQQLLEQAAKVQPNDDAIFERLCKLYEAKGEPHKLAQLIEARLEQEPDEDTRTTLEIRRARVLAGLGDSGAAREALLRVLQANPEDYEAVDTYAKLCVNDEAYEQAEQAWLGLARVAKTPAQQADVYRRLALLYDEQLNNTERAETCYQEVLKREPDDRAIREQLLALFARTEQPDKAVALQQAALERAQAPEDQCQHTLRLAQVFEEIARDADRAEETLNSARKNWPFDGDVLRAVTSFYRRTDDETADGFLGRSTKEVRRALATGRFDISFFEALKTVAELRGQTELTRIIGATLGALKHQTSDLEGAMARAGVRELDPLLAADFISAGFRAFMHKAGHLLDEAFPLNLNSLNAAPIPAAYRGIAQRTRDLAPAFGISDLELLVSSKLGATCLAARSHPAGIVFGEQLLQLDDEPARVFLTVRALKFVQARTSALARIAPIDLWPTAAAFLRCFAEDWEPPAVTEERLKEPTQKLRAALILSPGMDDDIPALALEAINDISKRSGQLGAAISQWANRTALLAVGDPTVAFRALRLASGKSAELPEEESARIKWIVRTPEARDIAVYSVSEAYAQARQHAGLSPPESEASDDND